MNPAIWRAYRNTLYRTGGAEIRIGRRCAVVDAMLARTQALVLISAHNPRSRLMPPGWNQRMHARLRAVTRRYHPKEATGTWHRWSEAHLAVITDPRAGAVFARRFRQNAIVIVPRGQPARLSVTLRPCGGVS